MIVKITFITRYHADDNDEYDDIKKNENLTIEYYKCNLVQDIMHGI